MSDRLPIALMALLFAVTAAAAAQQPETVAIQQPAQDPAGQPVKEPAKLKALPSGFAFTRLVMGELEKEDELTAKAYEELDGAAEKHGITLGKRHIVIYEVMGLKTFRKRVGYLLEAAPKRRSQQLGKAITLEKLPPVKAWMTSDKGDGKILIKARRRVLEEVWKPGTKRLDGIEIIEVYHGAPAEDGTPFDVYGPLAQKG